MTNHAIEKTKDHVIKLANKGDISNKNKQLILNFVDKLMAEGHKNGAYSPNRIRKYLYGLITMSKITKKDFDKATKEDINRLAAKIRDDYNGETPRDYLVMLRIFMRYIKELDGERLNENEFPDIVKNIKSGNRRFPNIKKSSLLTLEDVKELASHTQNLRDRSFILTLYESGCRIGELIGNENYSGVKIGDIKTDKYGAIIDVDGKTGLRSLRLIASAPAISNWLLEHPDRTNKNAPLFCGIWTNRGGKIQYRYWYDLLNGNNSKKKLKQGERGKGLGERAGIDKPMNPHHFRHSRASELAKFMTESQLCYYMGWEPGSKQTRTYVKLSGRDSEKTILAMYGIEEEEKKQSEFKPITCPRCGIKNDPAAKFCSGCSLGLDEKSVMEYDQQKENATKLGFDVQGMIGDQEFMMKMMNLMAKEWEKNTRRKISQ